MFQSSPVRVGRALEAALRKAAAYLVSILARPRGTGAHVRKWAL